jgi:nitrite reductase (NO-forming)
LTWVNLRGALSSKIDRKEMSMKKLLLQLLIGFVPGAAIAAGGALEGYAVGQQARIKGLPRVTQTLVAPPHLPKHTQVASGGPKIVQVRMVIEEKEIEVEPGVFLWAFTYNGSVPGPIVVAHEGDYIELTLVNPKTNQLPHNIDFHAATGALGGGEMTLVSPGEEAVLRWKAVKSGVFIYHCAPGGPMVPWHVVHGMNGAIMILPREGLKDGGGKRIKYDKAYYIGEQDFYLPKDAQGNYKRYPSPVASLQDDLEVMKKLIPTHVVFGEKVGALTGKNAMTAKVGETVLFIHSQANRPSYPHLIGGHGDYVWERGNFIDPPARGIESWVIAAGSAGAFVYTFRQPGLYAYLTHNLNEAFLLGAAGHVMVEGKWNLDLMEQVKKPSPTR